MSIADCPPIDSMFINLKEGTQLMHIYHTFLDNKYTRWYTSIIENRKTNSFTGYGENHHIIPKCCGGDNSKNNIVRLSAREHFICHLLLTKMVDDMHIKRKLTYALNRMTSSNKYTPRTYPSRYYTLARQKHAEMMTGENNYMYGKSHSEEARQKMSIAAKNQERLEATEETRRRISESLSGKQKTTDHRKSISVAMKDNEKICGENNHMHGKKHSTKTIQKMSKKKQASNNPMYGKNHSEESRKKISEGKKVPQKRIICQHCGKDGGASNMKRYHMENCKSINPS